jgi:hypothetical protein
MILLKEARIKTTYLRLEAENIHQISMIFQIILQTQSKQQKYHFLEKI